MQKRTKIVFFVFIGLVVIPILIFLILIFNRFHNWGSFHSSIQPMSRGTRWETEDGCLVFQNGYTQVSYKVPGESYSVLMGYECKGTLHKNGEDIDICVDFSSEAPEMFIYKCQDSGSVPHENCQLLEVWEAIDYKRNDGQIVYEMEVVKTMYFQEGEIINLVYGKSP